MDKKKMQAFKERSEHRKEENRKGRSVLAGLFLSTGRTARIAMHNGIIAMVYAAAMFAVFYAALQAAFFGVAFLAGSTGAYAMASAADLLTIYTIVVMVCGFVMFFAFAAEKAVIRAMLRRFWKSGPDGIDRGEAWKARHDAQD